jgi:HlyD family secretion protein
MDNGNPTAQSTVSPPEPYAERNGAKRKRRVPRKLLYLLGGLGFVGLVFYVFRPQPVAVTVDSVERGALQVTVEAEGQTRVRDRFVVAAPVDGRLSRIDLRAGDRLNAGQVVAQIDPLPLTSQVESAQARLRELQAQVAGVETQRPKPPALTQAESQIRAALAVQQQAEARVSQVEAALVQAQRDRQRAESLYAEGAIPQQNLESAQLTETTRQRELDTARQEVAVAIANVQSARDALAVLEAEQQDPDYLIDVYQAQIAGVEAELASLADDARRTTIAAPTSGQVFRILEPSARFVTAGTPLLELGDADSLELVVDILSADAVRVEPGVPVVIDHWGGEETLEATVRYVEPSAFTEVSALGVDEQRVNVIADFTVPPPLLGDGYRVDARIVVWESADVLKVPVSALFRCDVAWCTFVAENGRAQRRKVEIGFRSDLEAVVNAGLVEGEQVILHPNEAIAPGVRIQH